MGGDCSFTHTRSYWDHGTDGGGGALRQHTVGRQSVWSDRSFNILQPPTSNERTKRAAGFHTNRSAGSEATLQRIFFFFFVFFATPCQHAPLFLIWALLLRAIKWQTSPTSSHKSSSTVRWPVRKKTWLTLNVCGRWSNINRQYQQPIDYVLKRPDPAPKLVHFVPD